jgi:hypothetical protein
MNLTDLVQYMNDQLDYNPTLARYRNSVISLLNNAHEEILDEDAWLFQQATAELTLYATVTGSSTQTIAIGTGASNARRVDVTGVTLGSQYEGATFIGPDSEEYTIGGVDAVAGRLYLTSKYAGGAVTAGETDWSVEFRTYALPADCAEVLGFTDRTSNNRGRLTFIDRRKEEIELLRADRTGTPFSVIEDAWKQDKAPIFAPTATGQAGTDLPASTEYEYFYVTYGEGRESPPSTKVSVTLAGGENGVQIGNLQDTRWDDGSDANMETYRRKRVYRRDVTNNGPWVLAGVAESADATLDDDTLEPNGNTFTDWESAQTYVSHDFRQYVRFWYTASASETITLRYLKRPSPLVNDADVPDLPRPFRKLVAYRALVDLCLRHAPEQAQMWQARYDSRIVAMKSRYLNRTDRSIIKGSWSQGSRFGRVGTPVKT